MNKKTSNIVLITTVLIITFLISSCNKATSYFEVINNFLETYYEQFHETSKLREIEKELNLLVLQEGKSAPDSEYLNSYFAKFDELLTLNYKDVLIANRRLPNFKILSSGIDNFKIVDLNISKSKENICNVQYTLELYKDESLKDKKDINLTITLIEDRGNLKINSIQQEKSLY